MIADASVLVKMLAIETDSDIAAEFFLSEEVVAPDLIMIEAASALWSKLRRGETVAMRHDISRLEALIALMIPSSELVQDALDLAVALGHPVYDCLYLALAIRRDARLVTADQRFLAAVGQSAYARHIVALTAYPSIRLAG